MGQLEGFSSAKMESGEEMHDAEDGSHEGRHTNDPMESAATPPPPQAQASLCGPK